MSGISRSVICTYVGHTCWFYSCVKKIEVECYVYQDIYILEPLILFYSTISNYDNNLLFVVEKFAIEKKYLNLVIKRFTIESGS